MHKKKRKKKVHKKRRKITGKSVAWKWRQQKRKKNERQPTDVVNKTAAIITMLRKMSAKTFERKRKLRANSIAFVQWRKKMRKQNVNKVLYGKLCAAGIPFTFTWSL